MNRTVYRREPGPVPGLRHNLRPVNDEDDAALADLMERAYAGTIDEHLGGNSDGAVEIAGWRPTAVPHASFVADEDGIVAASLISRNGDDFWLAYVITHPEWKGRGLGTAVVAASLRALDAPVLAGVTDGNTPSERLLARLGFTPVQR
ncbi:GNAT family N-acetyltransferase [Lentzea flava]|uniref:GNAT family N-acetyltransferase n=1 Tax=Lentzea flava TaxID=103732 RepID=UPI0016717ADA|nr:GNAT family N-acetyltransferase [Lentzea flava]